jgi:hypothetical protein
MISCVRCSLRSGRCLMFDIGVAISCPECEQQYGAADGYVCTLVDHDHFRCPECGALCSISIDKDKNIDPEH